MVISQPPGNNPSYYFIVLHQRCLNCSECFQRLPYVLYMQYNIRVTHRNGAIKHILHESDPRRDHQQIVLYSFLSLHALALHLAVKILLQIFLYEDLSTLLPHTSVGLHVPSRMPADRTLLRSFLMPIK